MTSTTADSGSSPPEGIVFLDFDDALIFDSSWQRLHQQFGTNGESETHYEQYKVGEISFAEWGHLDAGLWAGEPIDHVEQAAATVDRIDDIGSTINTLRSDGFVVGVVSGGLRQFIEAVLADQQLDFLVANDLETADGQLTGDVTMNVTADSKDEIFSRLADSYDITLSQTVGVGNSPEDFQPDLQGLQIGLNPTSDETSRRADAILDGESLRPIVSIVQDWDSS